MSEKAMSVGPFIAVILVVALGSCAAYIDADSGDSDGLEKVRAPRRERRVAVFVVDELPILRHGLMSLLETEPDLELVGGVGNPDKGLASLKSWSRQRLSLVVLVSLDAQADAALGLIQKLSHQRDTAVLATSASPSPPLVRRVIAEGARGFIDKRAAPAEFVDALRRTARGESVLCKIPIAWLPHPSGRYSPSKLLTPAQQGVLSLAADGLSARQIARQLGIAERTVTTHLFRAYRQLGAHGRLDAVARARKLGAIRGDS